jgi:hypothetical protein
MPLQSWRRNPARNARIHRPAVKISWPQVGLPDPPEPQPPSIEEIRRQCLALSTYGLTCSPTPEPAQQSPAVRSRPASVEAGTGRRKHAA